MDESPSAVAPARPVEAAPAQHAGRSAAYLPALDGIRGLAILWVILHNTTDILPASFTGPLHPLVYPAHAGWMGVQLFFALSGFLITGGLLDTSGASNYFRGFYARRALRILPLYYSVLVVALVLLPHIASVPLLSGSTLRDQLSLWLFISNWTHVAPYGFGHFWSLAVEEQFYLCWPLLVYRLPARRLLVACLWISLGALLVRVALASFGADGWTIYSSTLCRMDALALGGAGACLLRLPALREALRRRIVTVSVAMLLLVLIGIPLAGGYNIATTSCQTIGYTILAIGSAYFVTAVALVDGRRRSRITAALRWAPLVSCGKYSFAMYVFHQLIHKLVGEPWLRMHFGPYLPARIVLVYSVGIALVSYALAFLSYHALEEHFLRLKRHFRPPEAIVRSAPGAIGA